MKYTSLFHKVKMLQCFLLIPEACVGRDLKSEFGEQSGNSCDLLFPFWEVRVPYCHICMEGFCPVQITAIH